MRMQRFFDHYLEGAPAPDWMVHGVPRIKMEAELKAVRARVNAELSGARKHGADGKVDRRSGRGAGG